MTDLVLRNGTFHTQDPTCPLARSIRIRGNRIVDVSLDEIADSGVETVDLEGSTVLPGFQDVHAHSVWFGLTMLELDLSAVASVDGVYEAVAERAATTPEGEWIVAAGFAPQRIDGQYPDRDVLDRSAGGRPVWIKHRSGHAASVNGAALERISHHADLAAEIVGGRVGRDEQGRPTGLLEENALTLVQNLLLPYSTHRIAEALDLATARYVAEGLTSVTDAGIGGGWIGHSPREFAGYQLALERGVLRTRMQPMFVIDALQPLAGHSSEPGALGLSGGIRTGLGDDRLRLGPVKIFSDGSLLGATASVTEPYAGCPDNHGYLQEDPASLRRRALGAYAGGWALAIHAIGDHAVDQAIAIIGEAQRRFGQNAVPNRIEHAGIVRDDQVTQIAELGIVVTPQPRFLYEFGDSMLNRVGPEREHFLYRAKSFLDAGVTLPGSSDRPVADGRVLSCIQSFVERRSSSGRIIGASERITVDQAIRAYTMGSALATGQARDQGSLSAGKFADLVVLGDDPLKIPSEQLGGTEIVGTMVDGQFVFAQPGSVLSQTDKSTLK